MGENGLAKFFDLSAQSDQHLIGMRFGGVDLAVFGALALVPTMVGAVATHLFIVGGSPVLPAILLLGSAGVLWARRDQLLGDRPTVR